jgi:hypothetical protein
MGGQLRHHFAPMLVLGAVAALILLGALAPVCSAADFPVSSKFHTRSTVDKKDFDGFHCKLEQGDKMSWDVSLVSGDLLNVYLMSGSNYETLKNGTSLSYFSPYSKQKTDFFEGQLNATGSPYTGNLVLVIMTQGEENSTSTYDVDVKITKAPTPQNLLDMICGLGPGICALLVLGLVVVIAIVYYIFKKVGGPMMGNSSSKDRSEFGSVDSMARPGFSVKIGPEAEPKRAKPTKKGKPTRTRAVVQPKAQPKTRLQRARVPGKCPGCGESVDEGQGFCPSCGADLE